MNMLGIGSILNLSKNNRPLSTQAGGTSADFCISPIDNAVGLSTLCLIVAAWVFTLMFI